MDDDVEIEETPGLAEFMPQGFGKQTREANTKAQIEQSKRNVVVESKAIKSKEREDSASDKNQSDDGDTDDDSDESSDAGEDFPVSHELIIKTHEKAVTTATLDLSGTRLVTGSSDCTMKFHDFASMTPTTLRAFKSVDPTASKTSANLETHPLHQVLFNPISPSQILVITALPQAKIFSRDGECTATTVKGDMYLRDMHNTKGHISEITSGTWHPTNPSVFVTAGTDSTLRIWDVYNMRSQKDVIVHKSRSAGSAGRTRMTAVAWGSQAQGGANVLVGAAYDGSLAMWSGDGPYTRPAGEIRDAHRPDTWTSSLDISPDGRTVVTRGGDDTLKLWDLRNFKKPISAASHPSSAAQYPTSTIRFSPDGSVILVGSPTGDLHILNRATLRPELVTPVTPGIPLLSAFWHAKINQIVTTSADSTTHVLYSPTVSHGGAKGIMLRAPKHRHIDDDPSLTTDTSAGLAGDEAARPAALSAAARHPHVGLTASGRPRDPRRPHQPEATPFAKNNPDERHVREHIPLSSMRDEDPREALLKYRDAAEKNRVFTKAWEKTQPVPVFADGSDSDADAPDRKKAKR